MCSRAFRPDSGEVVRTVPSALVTAALAAGVLTGCNVGSVRDEDVSLAGVRDAVVVSGGTERTASDGAKLGKGDRVRTGKSGSATLVVRDRRVVLAASTEVVVPDGATVELARGGLLVDRRRGPGVTVDAGDTTVDSIGTGALRVERRLSVLVAGLSATSRVRTATGPRLDLPALHQVTVAGRALPREAVPLQLRHDDWEHDVIGAVLADDTRLNALAAGLDGPGAIIPAAYQPPAGTRASDIVLVQAIARAAGKDPARARDLRARGGSWGVVAALLGTSAVRVGTTLAAVLDGAPDPSQSGGPSPTPGVVAGGSPRPVAGPSPSPSPNRPQPTRTGPTGSPRPTSTSSPSPTTSPTQTLEDVIGQIIPTPSIGLPLLR